MTLHRYFARRFLWMFLSVLTFFAVFQALADLIEEMRRLDDGFTLAQVLRLVALKLPESLYQILPLVMILATIALFLGLARSSELVVTRAAGRSGLTALLGPVLVAIAIGGLAVAMVNPIVATTSKAYNDLRGSEGEGGASALSIGRRGSGSGKLVRAGRR